MHNEILNFSPPKATKIYVILAKALKANINIYLKDVIILINDCLERGVFPDKSKSQDL